jgi:hypothetical protein
MFQADDVCAGEGRRRVWVLAGKMRGAKAWQRLERNAGQTSHKKLETESSDIAVFIDG